MTLDIIIHPLLTDTAHGFFGRAGGASSGVFAGLNCGHGSSDQKDSVAINRARVAAALDIVPDHLVGVHQVHSADVVVVHKAYETGPKADAIVTNQPDIGLGILTADCQPVLFADHEAGVIGAAHAGWKGALDGVLGATVHEMVRLGARPENIAAVIGPTISQSNYEVGPEFRDRFLHKDPVYDRFFLQGQRDKFHFDLPSFGLERLFEAGVKNAAWTGHCTYKDPGRFYSYRRSVHRSEPDYGRLISVIRL